jgi:hypothetical protein
MIHANIPPPTKHILKEEGMSYCGIIPTGLSYTSIEDAFVYNPTAPPCKNCIRRIVGLLQINTTTS